ncbi:AMP-dependent synthetase [Natrinema saccharevitans]|uniref:AMP-dependent synthetase n=1 Tax=Natrinema saccharevitans TaxID=301967 RepID=A0A1S8ARQ3_9EURY|nr:AMP-binding protein [Natrinema saccharevitans]OLZ39352.1 AMP-dependent synthetase [Natrinema saccharevitans]
MTRGRRLDAYHFYEDDWDSYEQLREAFEWDVPDRFNMATYLCDRWADDKSRVALFAEDASGTEETYTFWQLRNVTNRLANYLRAQGVEEGDRVGVNAPQRPETVFAHLAAWKLGAMSVPLSTLFGPDAIEYRLHDCDAVAAVVDESNIENVREARESLPNLETTLTVGDVTPDGAAGEAAFWDAIEDHSREFDTVETDAEDDAILIYTSGTTGDPKGVRHAQRLILGHLPLFVTTFGNMDLQEGDVFWTPAEWAWIASLFDVVMPALYYGKPVVAYNGGQFDPAAAFRLIERYGVSNFFAPPTALRMMMQVDDTDRFDVGTLRTIASGGESLGQSIVDWAQETFGDTAVHEGYGQTEANMLVGDCTALTEFREGYIGRAGPGHEVAIVDPETAEPTVETGETGEIAVRYEDNPVCFVEYWNKPGKTSGKVRNGWLLTEDLGRMDEDGYVAFVGRKDDVIISAGYRIGPEEVEDSVAGHESVADAAVIGVPDAERGEVPKAFVVLTADAEPSDDLRESIRQHVRDRLAKYEYPREIEVVDELPKTATGKVRRASLRNREER